MLALAIVVVAVVLSGPLLYATYRMTALPENAPRAFLAQGRRLPGQKVVVCLGDSITHGRSSFDWVSLLAGRLGAKGLQFVNAGINGELAFDARKRLPDVIACQPDAVVVLLGTNDVIGAVDAAAGRRMHFFKRLPSMPNPELFREHLEGIVLELKQRTGARIALCSLPLLGDDLSSPAHQKVSEYSGRVREVATAHGLSYVPLHEEMVRLRKAYGGAGRPFVMSMGLITKASLQRYLLGMDWDRITAANGFLFNPDSIHLNRQAGELLARLVEDFLEPTAATSAR